MKKYKNDSGEIGVLVSYGFGAGWSTWNTPDKFYAMDRGLVQLRIKCAPIDKVEKYCNKKGFEPYMGGWEDVQIEWLPKGTRFAINEYDGSESLLLTESLNLKT